MDLMPRGKLHGTGAAAMRMYGVETGAEPKLDPEGNRPPGTALPLPDLAPEPGRKTGQR